MADTSIEWADKTWNPIRGCSRVSEGCRNCYAERVAARFSGPGKPYERLAKMTPHGPRWTGKVRLIEERLYDPVGWTKPRRVFVNSMSDLFHEGLMDDQISDVFEIMGTAAQHTYQVLTKRPQRMRDFLAGFKPSPEHGPWPWKHVHLGVSVEDQATADERIPLLLETPAQVRWVSYEPALGPVDFRMWNPRRPQSQGEWMASVEGVGVIGKNRPLDWIVVGGESGPGARPFDLAWARSTVAQCREAGVACFMKQLGAHPGEYRECNRTDGRPGFFALGKLRDRKGGSPAEWPEDLRVREYPKP